MPSPNEYKHLTQHHSHTTNINQPQAPGVNKTTLTRVAPPPRTHRLAHTR